MELEKMDIEDLKILINQAANIIKEKEKEDKRKAFQAIIDAVNNYVTEYGPIDVNYGDNYYSCLNSESFNINRCEIYFY